MPSKRIDQLTQATTLAGTEDMVVLQGGETKRVAASVVAALGGGGGGGGGTPGGSTTQVQFNDAGSFGGDAGLTYDKTTDTLSVTGGVNTASYQLTSTAVVTEAGTTRTLSASDNGKIIYFSSTSPITVYTATGLGAGFSCMLVQGSTGQVTVSAGASTTLSAYLSQFKLAGQYATASLIAPSANVFILAGNTA